MAYINYIVTIIKNKTDIMLLIIQNNELNDNVRSSNNRFCMYYISCYLTMNIHLSSSYYYQWIQNQNNL